MWSVESVVAVSLSWAESSWSVVAVMSFISVSVTMVWGIMKSPFMMVIGVVLLSMWVVLDVVAWPVNITVVFRVRSGPVWACLSMWAVENSLHSWMKVSSGNFVGGLKCVSLSHLVSVLLLMGLNFSSVLSDVVVILRVRELMWVDNECLVERGSDNLAWKH